MWNNYIVKFARIMANKQEKEQRPGPSNTVRQKPIAASDGKSLKDLATYELTPPDGGWGWIVVFAAFMSLFMTEGTITAFGTFLPDMAASFGTSKSSIANMGAVKTAVFCLVGRYVAFFIFTQIKWLSLYFHKKKALVTFSQIKLNTVKFKCKEQGYYELHNKGHLRIAS